MKNKNKSSVLRLEDWGVIRRGSRSPTSKVFRFYSVMGSHKMIIIREGNAFF